MSERLVTSIDDEHFWQIIICTMKGEKLCIIKKNTIKNGQDYKNKETALGSLFSVRKIILTSS